MPSRVDAEDLNASNDDQWIVDGWPIDRRRTTNDAHGFDLREGANMTMRVTIRVETETLSDSRTMFRLRIGEKVVDENLTAVQAHLLVSEILQRIVLRNAVAAPGTAPSAERKQLLKTDFAGRPRSVEEKAAA